MADNPEARPAEVPVFPVSDALHAHSFFMNGRQHSRLPTVW